MTRNVLDAGVLDELREQATVTVFVPKEKEEYLRRLYGREGVRFVGLDLEPYIRGRRNTLFARVAEVLLDTRTKRNHQRAYAFAGGSRFKYLAARMTMTLFGHPPLSWVAWPLFRSAELHLNNPDPFKEYFAERPEVAFVTDPFDERDVLFWKSAKRAGVRDVVLVRSWDNLVNKTLMRVRPSKLIVQNEDMVEEAVRFHAIPRSRIKVGGVPQFEYYRRYTPTPREEFCKSMGIEPDKRIILFSPAGRKYTDTDWQICEILKQQIIHGELPSDAHVLVRLHPQNYTDLSQFVPDEHFTIEDPGVGLKTDRVKEVEFSRATVNHLADELYHCALVINVISSIMIDAAVFDRPTLTVGFDGWEKDVPFLRSIAREAGEEWLQVLFDTGVTPVARNQVELAELVREYLAHPEKDREVRARFVERHCAGLTGDSAARIARMVLSA
ncbi:MAG TPA: CDP-glycerol glycerophosphotransferase family protein [Candidatus Paceibacterota bacterium]|nr:CDP-glycerol glycerophosphotransferase family protein [Candidatus Paceibacterota bacterium]